MRCPKCGYISFDYNKVCPKCSKDIISEQAKLNLPAFRPDPPSLLGILTGDANESNIGINVGSSGTMDSSEMDMDFDDSVAMDSESLSYDDSEEMVISLDSEDSGEFDMPDSLSVTEDEGFSGIDMETGDEEISLETEEISLAEEDEAAAGEEGISFDMDEISLDEFDELETVPEEIPVKKEEPKPAPSFTPGVHKSQQDLMQSSVELNLDDLKINATGELEIGDISTEQYVKAGAEEPFDLEALPLEEPGTSADDEISFEESAELDLGDLEIEIEPDMGSLSMDDTETDAEITAVEADLQSEKKEAGAATGKQDFEEDDLSLDDAFDLDSMDLDNDEDLSLDLDNLDIDLDLDEPEDKS